MGSAGLGGEELLALEGMSIDVPAVKYYVDSNGEMKRMLMPMSMTIDMEPLGKITMKVDIDIEIIAVGAKVTVTLPNDLGTYVLIESE